MPSADARVVRDQSPTLVDSPERQVRFAAARRPAQQDSVPVNGDAGGVDCDHGGRGGGMQKGASIMAGARGLVFVNLCNLRMNSSFMIMVFRHRGNHGFS